MLSEGCSEALSLNKERNEKSAKLISIEAHSPKTVTLTGAKDKILHNQVQQDGKQANVTSFNPYHTLTLIHDANRPPLSLVRRRP